MLLVIVSWLSARTLDRIDALSDQVQAMSVSLLQVPELAATVREHDHRLAVLEARGLIVSPLADRQ
ncbi:hypothetical protein [Nevskia ramosa]|uniref:hypothetical protein n=1 Tax=Nevskia ramosa TaxID=64002 RepID=UPI0012EBD11A|nr:hypothetical protein [Nevskia ramosa]